MQNHLTLFLIDEAQKVLPSSDLHKDDLISHPLISAISESRKLRVGMILAINNPGMVHPSFISQAGFLLVGPVGDADLRFIRLMLNLTPDQFNYYITMGQRHFICKKTGAPPFPVVIPEVKLSERYFDAKAIKDWNKPIVLKTPSLEKLFYRENNKPPIDIQQVTPLKGEPVQQPKVTPTKDDYHLFLEVVNEHPCHQVTWYYKHFDSNKIFALQKSDRLRKELEKKEFIRVHSIWNGKHISKGIEITEEGYTKYGLKQKWRLWKGADFPHSYLAQNLMRKFEKQGEQVTREKQLGSHFADIFVAPDLYVEVAIGNRQDRETQNAIADAAHGSVLVVGNDENHLDKIKKLLPSDVTVEFKLFCEIVK